MAARTIFTSVRIISHNRTDLYITRTDHLVVSCRRLPGTACGDTDTDATPEKESVGGLGKYSHGVFNLTHQHWVMEVESAGGFNVHDTEAAEAFHKNCMRLPAARVRHYSNANRTCAHMQKYLMHDHVFKSLYNRLFTDDKPEKQGTTGVVVPLRQLIGNSWVPVSMGHQLHLVQRQQQIIHKEVRLARSELLDLLCFQLELPATRSSVRILVTICADVMISCAYVSKICTDVSMISADVSNICADV